MVALYHRFSSFIAISTLEVVCNKICRLPDLYLGLIDCLLDYAFYCTVFFQVVDLLIKADAEAEIKLSSWGTLLDFFEY